MSIPVQTDVTCPHCRTAIPVTVWESINTKHNPELPRKIISGEFFIVECPKCEFKTHIEYPLLYHDIRKRAMIWVVLADENSNEPFLNDIRKEALLPGYLSRVVNNVNELREKVGALESGRDDRCIELTKAYLSHVLALQAPDFVVNFVVYSYQNNEELILFHDREMNILHCPLDVEMYEFISECYSEEIEQISLTPFSIVDVNWGKKVIPSLESLAKRLEEGGKKL